VLTVSRNHGNTLLDQSLYLVFDGGIRQVVARHVDVAIIKRLLPARDRTQQGIRNRIGALSQTQQAGQRGRLIVGIKTHRTGQVQCTLDITLAVE